MREEGVLADAGSAVGLDRAVDDTQRHVRRDDLDPRDLPATKSRRRKDNRHVSFDLRASGECSSRRGESRSQNGHAS